MHYSEFREKTQKLPFFRSNVFEHFTDNVALLRRQLVDWEKKGYVLELKRGFYTLRNNDRKANFSRMVLANNLYTPSYISLEGALSFYGLIPEEVKAVTSITTKKTQSFTNKFGTFYYRHIKQSCYNHFITKKDQFNTTFFIATKEKALLDFFYFKMRDIDKIEETIFEDSFRLQNLDSLDKKKLLSIAEQYQTKKLLNIVNSLLNYIEKNYA